MFRKGFTPSDTPRFVSPSRVRRALSLALLCCMSCASVKPITAKREFKKAERKKSAKNVVAYIITLIAIGAATHEYQTNHK